MEDFIPLAQKLAQRTTAFEEWKKQISVMRMLASDKEGNSEKLSTLYAKILGLIIVKFLDIFTLRELINHWKSSRYPHCEEIVYVQGMVNNFDKIASTACKVINRKIRLRLVADLMDFIKFVLSDFNNLTANSYAVQDAL